MESLDLEGQIFGELTVICRAGSIDGRSAWRCSCSCGKEKIIIGKNLKSGNSKTCGDCNPLNIGDKKGRLTVASDSFRFEGATYIDCICDCGIKKSYLLGNIKSGHTKSCGCLKNTHPVNWNDLTGNVYGLLTVLAPSASRVTEGGHIKARFSCECVCGKKLIVDAEKLVTGRTQSCGCKVFNPESAYRKLYGDYKSQAKRNNNEFELSYEEFISIIQKKCIYCGVQPLQVAKGWHQGNQELLYNGIDRVDNNKGYTILNSAPSCFCCNQMKSDQKLECFIKQIGRIIENGNLNEMEFVVNDFENNQPVVSMTLWRYKRNAKERGIEFNLLESLFKRLISSRCYYCNTVPSQVRRHVKKGMAIKINGIDRINNNLGYTEQNSVPCCKTCNRMKSDMSLKGFYKHLHTIQKYYIDKLKY
ncbi:hypothetical protein RGQ13_01695 [Thalassotalea psychrophila]|uniref:HNH endonuclease n=1 Tax=Thalassotalea psychrophila TaxID=3065647 RepID=A0ABY9TV82_9GAMM|nr:hypothetical protein RGQ13_01695 [Colwelliaceae bacterium SQ149]